MLQRAGALHSLGLCPWSHTCTFQKTRRAGNQRLAAVNHVRGFGRFHPAGIPQVPPIGGEQALAGRGQYAVGGLPQAARFDAIRGQQPTQARIGDVDALRVAAVLATKLLGMNAGAERQDGGEKQQG